MYGFPPQATPSHMQQARQSAGGARPRDLRSILLLLYPQAMGYSNGMGRPTMMIPSMAPSTSGQQHPQMVRTCPRSCTAWQRRPSDQAVLQAQHLHVGHQQAYGNPYGTDPMMMMAVCCYFELWGPAR